MIFLVDKIQVYNMLNSTMVLKQSHNVTVSTIQLDFKNIHKHVCISNAMLSSICAALYKELTIYTRSYKSSKG